MSSTNSFAALRDHDYLSLETFRKNGTGVPTPVWFAADPEKQLNSADASLFVYTVDNTGKVKRVRNNSRVRVAPCDRGGKLLGEWIEARAEIVTGATAARGLKLLSAKYFLKRLFDVFAVFRKTQRAVILIRPAS
jgi:PPOX class probable F420-dependent enzyme